MRILVNFYKIIFCETINMRTKHVILLGKCVN